MKEGIVIQLDQACIERYGRFSESRIQQAIDGFPEGKRRSYIDRRKAQVFLSIEKRMKVRTNDSGIPDSGPLIQTTGLLTNL